MAQGDSASNGSMQDAAMRQADGAAEIKAEPSANVKVEAEPKAEQSANVKAEVASECKVEDEKSSGADAEKKKAQAFTGWQYKVSTYDSALLWTGDTLVEYKPNGKRMNSRSGERYAKYSQAATIGEALKLGAIPKDLLNDFEVGLLTIVGGPMRERPLDLDMFRELLASSQVTETDWILKQFISKGGRLPGCRLRPTKPTSQPRNSQPSGSAAAPKASGGGKSAGSKAGGAVTSGGRLPGCRLRPTKSTSKPRKSQPSGSAAAPKASGGGKSACSKAGGAVTSEAATKAATKAGSVPTSEAWLLTSMFVKKEAGGKKRASSEPPTPEAAPKQEAPAVSEPTVAQSPGEAPKRLKIAKPATSVSPSTPQASSATQAQKATSSAPTPARTPVASKRAAERSEEATPSPPQKKQLAAAPGDCESGKSIKSFVRYGKKADNAETNFLARFAKAQKVPDAVKAEKVKADRVEKADKAAKAAAAAELDRCAGAGALMAADDRDGDTNENGDEGEELDDGVWDVNRRTELAASLWAADDSGVPVGDQPTPRVTFTAVQQAAYTSNEPIRVIALLLRPLLAGGHDDELISMLDLLLSDNGEVTHAHLGECMSRAFALNSLETRSLPPRDLADAAVVGRRKQRTFYKGKLMAADLGKALAAYRDGEGAKFTPWNAVPKELLEQLTKVLANSVESETRQIVRIMQGQRLVRRDIMLRSLAHAAILARSSSPTCPQQRAEHIVAMEDAVMRAFAQDGGRVKKLAAGLLRAASPEELVAAVTPACGVQVLPMRCEALKDVQTAVERSGGVDLLVEWLYVGERVQVHWSAGGASVEAFSKRIKWSTDKQAMSSEVNALLSSCLDVQGDCILDTILVRNRVKDPQAPDQARVMVVLDMLSLNGRNLCLCPLRERRAELTKVLKPSTRVRLPYSNEVLASANVTEEIATRLETSLAAADRARGSGDPVLKADELLGFMKTMGVVVKRLDGPDACYSGGRRHCSWQVLRQPSVSGAEADKMLFEHLSDEAKGHIPSREEFMFTVVSGRRTGTKEGIKDILNIQKQYTDAGIAPRWYVDVESLEDYKKLGLDAYPGGKLIPSRNAALDDAFKAGKVCVQTSDDISKWEFVVGEADGKKIRDMSEANARARFADHYVVSPVAAAQFLLANMRARQDCKLGGVYCLSNAGRAMCQDRYGYAQFIMGDFFVSEPSDIRFDTRLDLKEDYDYTAAHLHQFGSVVRCNHMLIHAKHLTNAGGACSYRNAEREQRNIAILKEKWGSAIRDNPNRPNEVLLMWNARPKRLGGKAKD